MWDKVVGVKVCLDNCNVQSFSLTLFIYCSGVGWYLSYILRIGTLEKSLLIVETIWKVVMSTNCWAMCLDIILLSITVQKRILFFKYLILSHSYFLVCYFRFISSQSNLEVPGRWLSGNMQQCRMKAQFLRILCFVEIPLRLMMEEKTCGVHWVDHSSTGCFIFLCLVFIHSNNYNECIKNKACRPGDLSCNQHKLECRKI